MTESFAKMYGNTGKDKAKVRAGKMPVDTSLGRASNRYNADFVRDVIKPDLDRERRQDAVKTGKSSADSYGKNLSNNKKTYAKQEMQAGKVKAMKEKLNKMMEKKKAK